MQIAIKQSEGKPGPKYLLRSTVNDVSGGVISEATPKTDVEWEIYRAKQIPGEQQVFIRFVFSRRVTNVALFPEQAQGLTTSLGTIK